LPAFRILEAGMAAITSSARFTSTLAAADVRSKALDWFKSYTYKIEVDEPSELVVYTGSQVKMRLLGGAFIAGSSLPTRTTIELAASGAGTAVTITARDSVGLGVKTGMKGKYEGWTAEITAGLRAACSGGSATAG
jgi:hypothetical protein